MLIPLGKARYIYLSQFNCCLRLLFILPFVCVLCSLCLTHTFTLSIVLLTLLLHFGFTTHFCVYSIIRSRIRDQPTENASLDDTQLLIHRWDDMKE